MFHSKVQKSTARWLNNKVAIQTVFYSNRVQKGKVQEHRNSLAVWSDKRKRVPLRKNEAGVNANKGKPMKTVFRCI